MRDSLARFRDLKGVGPATEARLHEAGVFTWEALAEVLDAIAAVRSGTGDPLRDLADQVAARVSAAEAAAPDPPGGERSEAFVIRMSLTSDGRPTRSTVTHVRTQDEQPLAGWPPDEVIRFVEAQSGVAAAPVPAPAATADASRPAPAAAPAATRDHLVVLDAGKAVGGAARSIELVVATDQAADVGEFEFRATLAGRAYGQPPEAAASWTILASRSGRAHPPDRLPLRFEAILLPRGVQRLRLEMALRLPASRRAAPALALR
jgi:predicted flap endonuclease-1-like 5' DNA nuclease